MSYLDLDKVVESGGQSDLKHYFPYNKPVSNCLKLHFYNKTYEIQTHTIYLYEVIKTKKKLNNGSQIGR